MKKKRESKRKVTWWRVGAE